MPCWRCAPPETGRADHHGNKIEYMKLGGLLLMALPVFAQYSVHREGDVVRLEDAKAQTSVSIMPSRGNSAFQMRVKGKDVLRFPYASLEEYLKGGARDERHSVPRALGQPARRDCLLRQRQEVSVQHGAGQRAPGPEQSSDPRLPDERAAVAGGGGQIRRQRRVGHQPAGVLPAAAVDGAVPVRAHHRDDLSAAGRRARSAARNSNNLSTEPMPVAIGFHPYFQVNDAPRDEWTFGIAARIRVAPDPNKVPTGEKRPIEQLLPKPQGGTLAGPAASITSSATCARRRRARPPCGCRANRREIEVVFGPNYKAVVVYAPGGPEQRFICFEPMAGITNAMNMAHRGTYQELQSIPPGQTWQESFWVRPSGF